MKRKLVAAISLLAALALAVTAVAQGRHDEKPHNPALNKATGTDTVNVETPSSTGGRHDEKPHGATKKKAAPKKADTNPAPAAAPTTTPAIAPEAKGPTQ